MIAADFSPSRLEVARANLASRGFTIPVLQEDVTRLSFSNGAFDSVLCWGVLMHVPAVKLAIAELCRVTRLGGYVIVSENSARSLFSWVLTAGVNAKRALRRAGTNRIERNRLGLESWVRAPNGEYLIRRVFIGPFVQEFREHGCQLVATLPGEFSEAYRFFRSDSLSARAFHAINRAWFHLGLTFGGMGRIFIFQRG